MTILERIAELEKRLLKQMPEGTPEQDAKAEEAIHRFAMLVAQAALEVGVTWPRRFYFWDKEDREKAARQIFPLPPKRVLREEPDPNGGEVLWRWNEWLEFMPNAIHNPAELKRWIRLTAPDCDRTFAPYPGRIDLWHSLKHNPYKEVPDNGDDL